MLAQPCQTLARVRRWIRATPAIQVNIAAAGGEKVNVERDVERERLASWPISACATWRKAESGVE
jgi:hypothetical protein